MAATETATDREAITIAVQLYVDGASAGDVAKLKEAFHPEAWMFGSLGAQRVDMPIAQMIDMVARQPLTSKARTPHQSRPSDQSAAARRPRLRGTGGWVGWSLFETLALPRFDGPWRMFT